MRKATENVHSIKNPDRNVLIHIKRGKNRIYKLWKKVKMKRCERKNRVIIFRITAFAGYPDNDEQRILAVPAHG